LKRSDVISTEYLAADTRACPGYGVAVAAKSIRLPLVAFMLVVALIIQPYTNKSDDGAKATLTAPIGAAEQ
jgi:hypothetical protein